MNLADAIRNAKIIAQEPTLPQIAPEKNTESNRNNTWIEAEETNSNRFARIEFDLSTEELGRLFKFILEGQHSVFTLNEAAHYLRTCNKTVESLADSGELSGFRVNGKWRFTKQAIEDWMNKSNKGAAA